MTITQFVVGYLIAALLYDIIKLTIRGGLAMIFATIKHYFIKNRLN